MDLDLSYLRTRLSALEVDGYLIDDDAETSNQRYLSGYDASDPFITLVTSEETKLLFWGMDYFRAQGRCRADSLHQHTEYDYDGYGDPEEQYRVIAEFLGDHDVHSVIVPRRFPLGTAEGLRERGIEVIYDAEGLVETTRERKVPGEVERMCETQRTAELALREAEDLLREATVEDGVLRYDGAPVTADRLSTAITTTLFEHDCFLPEATVATGERPFGSFDGPIEAGQPVQIDVAPTSMTNGYASDMARTFVRGEPDDVLQERYETVTSALDHALEAVDPGVPGARIHDRLCTFFEERGYSTPRTDDGIDDRVGVPHIMGHGVGLDTHEAPICGPDGGTLRAGNVISIEPALYEPGRGGIIVEDMIHVTASGPEVITKYPKEFVLG